MLDLLFEKLATPDFVFGILTAVAVAATIITMAMPLLETNVLDQRMKAVALERERVRVRERERLARAEPKNSVRFVQKDFMKRIVEQFQLKRWLTTDQARMQLAKAGYRGEPAEVAFMFFRLVTPITLFIGTAVYVTLLADWHQPALVKFGACIGAAYGGIKLPEIYLSNQAQKRRLSIAQAYPNALDLLLICIESGMSIEQSFRKVSVEIGSESVPMAEEFSLTTAEISYLPDRRVAFENLASRTGLPAMKSLATVLNQSEKYGTSLGSGLRVLAQEGRDERMQNAEKKAAALPPKLTVPMILFFLPVLFCVIIFPAVIDVMHWS